MGRIVLIVIATLATLGGVLAIGAHYWSPGSLYTLALAAFTPYLALAGIVGLVLFAVVRGSVGWIGLAVALTVTIWQFALQAPLFVSSTAPNGHRVTVMTSNLKIGAGDAVVLTNAVRKHGVDLLMLEELTPVEQTALKAAGLNRLLPYHLSGPAEGGAGTGLWSRYPLSSGRINHTLGFTFVTARAALPGGDASVVALHVYGPQPNSQFPHWHDDMRRLPAILHDIPTGHPVIVGGDFNATPDVAQLRNLLTNGYADAANQAGAGITATYPSNRWFGPLIAIDHVLTRGATATTVDTINIPGSDHRALLARVVLPR